MKLILYSALLTIFVFEVLSANALTDKIKNPVPSQGPHSLETHKAADPRVEVESLNKNNATNDTEVRNDDPTDIPVPPGPEPLRSSSQIPPTTTSTKPHPPTPPTTTTSSPQPPTTSTPTPPTTSTSTETPPTTKPTPTTASPNVTTVSPTPHPEPTQSPNKTDRKFDGLSFFAGIVLSAGLLAIGVVAYKFYEARRERNYHTL